MCLYLPLSSSSLFSFFFFNDTATTEIYTLSLHDALPIFHVADVRRGLERATVSQALDDADNGLLRDLGVLQEGSLTDRKSTRLNSSHSQISYAVFCLKKKNITKLKPMPCSHMTLQLAAQL